MLNEKEMKQYCMDYGIRYKGGMKLLPSREIKPEIYKESRREFMKWFRRHSDEPLEETLPKGVSLANPRVMNMVFEGLVQSEVIR